MKNKFNFKANMAPIFLAFSIALVNLIFYTTLGLTVTTRYQLNIDAGVFNVFFILALFSVIKILRKNPKQLLHSQEKYQKFVEQFYDSDFYKQNRANPDEDELFDQFLQLKKLRFCKTCVTFKVD